MRLHIKRDTTIEDIRRFCANGEPIELVFGANTEAKFPELEKCIKEFPAQFKRFYITYHPEKHQPIVQFLRSLNDANCPIVYLITKEELVPRIAPLAKEIYYPLLVIDNNNQSVVSDEFENIIIANIQSRPLRSPPAPIAPEAVDNDPLAKPIPLKELIRNKKTSEIVIPTEVQHTENLEQREVVEVKAAVEVQAIQEVQHQVEEAVQTYTEKLVDFEDFIKNFKDITTECLEYTQPTLTSVLHEKLHQELFANLPHAIKYLTPAAAREMAANLPAYVTINKDNLPQGFLLKQTRNEEWVLDYDPFIEKKLSNPFTPRRLEFEPRPTYWVDWQDKKAKFKQYFPKPFKDTEWNRDKPLDLYDEFQWHHLNNLWIKYGDTGVDAVLGNIHRITAVNAERQQFIFRHYIKHLPQLDHLHENQAFYNALQKMIAYDENKWTCLKKFLHHTGESWHDLTHTLTAFEAFWNELETLCIQHGVSSSEINKTTWSTGGCGNPAVYMERMLCILKNARNFKDQLKSLNEINLSNYGAYYASRYEDFTLVSAEMDVNYRPEDEYLHESLNWKFASDAPKGYERVHVNGKIRYRSCFDKDRLLYRTQFSSIWQNYPTAAMPAIGRSYTEWDTRIDIKNSRQTWEKDTATLTMVQCFRLIGSSDGIVLNELLDSLVKYLDPTASYNIDHAGKSIGLPIEYGRVSYDRFLRSDIIRSFLPLVFFINKTRAEKPSIEFLDLFKSGNLAIYVAIKDYLIPLEQKGIILDQMQAYFLFKSIINMQSWDLATYFPELYPPKPSGYTDYYTKQFFRNSLNKLFSQLEKNKFAVLKWMAVRSRADINSDFPFIFALDTADALGKNPVVEAVYRDDLLLFSELISNSDRTQAFYDTQVTLPHFSKYDAKPTLATARLENVRKVGEFLHKAAVGKQQGGNNLSYAVDLILQAKQYFSYTTFLTACSLIEKLPTVDVERVDSILTEHGFQTRRIETPTLSLPEKTTDDLKKDLVAFILRLRETELVVPYKREIASLEKKFEKDSEENLIEFEQSSAAIESRYNQALTELETKLKELNVESLLQELEKWVPKGSEALQTQKIIMMKQIGFQCHLEFSDLVKCIVDKIISVDFGDEEALGNIFSKSQALGKLFGSILRNPTVMANQKEFVKLFKAVDFSKFNYPQLYRLFNLLKEIGRRDYLQLLTILLANDAILALDDDFITNIELLFTQQFPTEYLISFAQRDFPLETSNKIASALIEMPIGDPILEFIMKHPAIPFEQIQKITSDVPDRDKLVKFFTEGVAKENLPAVFECLYRLKNTARKNILDIVSICFSVNNDYILITKDIALLETLGDEKLDLLYRHIDVAPVSLNCLIHGLKHYKAEDDFSQFLANFERAPFGERSEEQFSTAEVERVINATWDMRNGSIYPKAYRQQMMEAFLFVNAIGKDLAAYDGKAAQEMSNQEIKAYFAKLKNPPLDFPQLTAFQKRLLALGLMREAIYRSSGEFPYSTQIIALIDGMMHSGDYISNIDTGQGKSLIDTMKAALLWLDSDRVDVTTSSIVDSQKDIKEYGQFLDALGIPYSKNPITALSAIEAFQPRGINFSTFSQLSLFYAKAAVHGVEVDKPDDKISLVINESDYNILDDQVTYRFAISDPTSIGEEQQWMYDVINELVTHPDFLSSGNSTRQDVIALKNLLRTRAYQKNLSATSISKFTDEQYISWIEAGILVNHVLEENHHYVVPPATETRVIQGRTVEANMVKILMKDGKVSPDSTFGNGVQQLLCAKLNKEYPGKYFAITPQNKTIISANNKNLIDHYRARKGFIWGSSGTVGSKAEIIEQYAKYGLEFSKIAPHQKLIVETTKAIIEKDEQNQFKTLSRKLNKASKNIPHLVFFADINTAKRFYATLNSDQNVQIYTGVGDEASIIAKAKQPGMITIATSALSRNTNIRYARKKGMEVWDTTIDSFRRSQQKKGRTGREGSPGKVHYILNKAKFPHGFSIEKLQAEIDERDAMARRINEDLYNLIGFLMHEVQNLLDKDKDAFLKTEWSSFANETEKMYKTQLQDKIYNAHEFVVQRLNKFNDMVRDSIPNYPGLSFESYNTALTSIAPGTAYTADSTPVKMADCTPPVDIAFNLLNIDPPDPAAALPDIKNKLSNLFSNIAKGKFLDTTTDYLRYITSSKLTRDYVARVHKEFLTEFMSPAPNEHIKNLADIASNSRYLVAFQALTQVSSSDDTLQIIKDSVVKLLENYCKCWFIIPKRKEDAQALIKKILGCQSSGDIFRTLADTQQKIAQDDTKSNKKLHLMGESRYQTAVSKSLNLAAALSGGKVDVSEFTQSLDRLLKDDKVDRFNANVIRKALENAENIHKRRSDLGMQGRRHTFFRPASQAPSPAAKPSAPESSDPSHTNAKR